MEYSVRSYPNTINSFWKGREVIIGVAIFVAVFLAAFLFLNSDEKSITGNIINEDKETANEEAETSSSLLDSYSIDKESCGSFETGRINQAFNIIANQTDEIVKFYELDSNGDITINCFREIPKTLEYLVGGALADSTENSINFYGIDSFANNRFPGGCATYPNIEIREILHVLGFNYSNYRYSIMYGVAPPGCLIKDIDEHIVQELKDRYS